MQINLFTDQKTLINQRKLLEELIELKSSQIREEVFQNFYGTTDAIKLKELEAEERVQRFITKVTKSFPDLY